MASFLVKHVVRHIAKEAGCSEERVDKLGHIAKVSTAIATWDILGVIIDRDLRKYCENKEYERKCTFALDEMCHYDFEWDEEVEVEGTDSEGHHKELAKIQPFLVMAMAAYKDEEMEIKFPKFVERSQLIRKPSIKAKVHVCVLMDGTLAFVFRGTQPTNWNPLGDILTDMKQKQVPLEHYHASQTDSYISESSDVKVHKGFLLAFQDVTRTHRHDENLQLVAEGLGVKEADVKQVVCIGHSLGGALATLCAHWCRYVAYPNAQILCVTMGSPRVGNKAFANDFNMNVTKGRSYRVVNKGDLVPLIPRFITYPKRRSPYNHVEGLLHLLEHPTSKDTISIKRKSSFVLPSVMDHPCIAYNNSIDKALMATVFKCQITLPPNNWP